MRALRPRSVRLSCHAFIVAALVFAGCRADRQTAAVVPRSTPPVRGEVVYQRPDGIYKTVIGRPESIPLALDGSYPRWSPDGQSVAFVRGHQIMRVPANGGEAERLADADDARAVAWHPNGLEVLFTDGQSIKSVALDTRAVRTVVSGHTFRELDFALPARLVTSTRRFGVSIRAFDLATGRDWKISSGCSASLSPNGERVTNNSDNHRQLLLRRWTNGEIVQTLDAPPGRTLDNQYWSNESNWIASVSDDTDQTDVFVISVSQNRAWQVTFTGDCDRPDLYVTEVP
jgi:hypothetical protein